MKAQQVGEKEHTRAWMSIEEFAPSTVRNPKSFFYCFVLFLFFVFWVFFNESYIGLNGWIVPALTADCEVYIHVPPGLALKFLSFFFQ